MTDNLLWIEKYRPQNLEDIIGQSKTINLLDKMIDNGSLPHLILNGKSGTGKTSTIMALVNKLYIDNNIYSML